MALSVDTKQAADMTPRRLPPHRLALHWLRTATFAPPWLPDRWRHPLVGYAGATCIAVASVALSDLLVASLPGYAFPAALSLLAVLGIAVTWGAGPALLASLLAGIFLNFYVLSPRSAWDFRRAGDTMGFVVFLLAGLGIGLLASQAESRRRDADALARRVREERDRLQQVLDALPAGVVLADASGRFTMANQAVVPIFGAGIPGRPVPRGPFEAHEVYGVYRLDGTPYPSQELPLQRSLWRGEAVRGEQFLTRVPDTGREIVVLANSTPLRDPKGAIAGAVGVFQDITPLRELERAREDFLSWAAHDLKNPLTSIRGQAELAQRRLARPDGAAAALAQLARIQEDADAMVGLIDELEDVARQQMGGVVELHRATADLVALVRCRAEALREATGRTIHLEAAVPELRGEVDAARIARVVGNLLSNAYKYSPAKGAIWVRVALEAGGARPEALIAVRDEGIGIPAADLPYIFDRFRRAGNVASHIQGTGIGLASARGIVEQHGGSIEVESIEGAGSTFTVRLPLKPL